MRINILEKTVILIKLLIGQSVLLCLTSSTIRLCYTLSSFKRMDLKIFLNRQREPREEVLVFSAACMGAAGDGQEFLLTCGIQYFGSSSLSGVAIANV